MIRLPEAKVPPAKAYRTAPRSKAARKAAKAAKREAFHKASARAGAPVRNLIENRDLEIVEAELPEAFCPQCDGDGALLGSLGRTNHFRCIQCGWTFSA